MSVAEGFLPGVLGQREFGDCVSSGAGVAVCALGGKAGERACRGERSEAMKKMLPKVGEHVPVMLGECLSMLAPRPGEVMVDGTLGLGGHARRIAEALGESGRLIGVDRDEEMLSLAGQRLGGMDVEMVRGNFSELDAHVRRLGVGGVDGVLLDLGVASAQLDAAGRGLSYRREGPLDMRLTRGEGLSAAEWLNRAVEEEIARVIREYGEERYARRIARGIVSARKRGRIETTGALADVIGRSVPGGRRRLHPARRTFQAVRIFINREIEHLERFLRVLPEALNPGGRCVIITYHSLEDRPVKRAFRDGAKAGVYEALTRKPLRAGESEVRENPRSRSAKLRAVRRVVEGGGL